MRSGTKSKGIFNEFVSEHVESKRDTDQEKRVLQGFEKLCSHTVGNVVELN